MRKGQSMRRLVGWLLVWGMSGCGLQENPPTAKEPVTAADNTPTSTIQEQQPRATPLAPAAPTTSPPDNSITSSALATLEKLGAQITRNERGRVDRVDFKIDNKISDAGLVHLAGLTDLQQLGLGLTTIGDAGLVHVAGLTNLHVLVLASTKISDHGLVHLAGLASLQELYLSNTQITDAGLAHFKHLTKLQKLRVDGTRITESGAAELQQALPNCLIVR